MRAMAPLLPPVFVDQICLLSLVVRTRLPSARMTSLALPELNSSPEARVVPAGIFAPGTESIW